MIPRTTEHQHCTTTLGTGSSRHARILLPAVQSCRRTRVILSLCSGVMSPTADADRASADRGARPSRRRPPPARPRVRSPSRPVPPSVTWAKRASCQPRGGAPTTPPLCRSLTPARTATGRRSFCIGTARARRARHHWVRGRRRGLGAPTPARTPPGVQAPALAPCSATQLEWRPRADVRRDASATQQRRAPYPGGNWDWDLGTSKNERRSDQALHSRHRPGCRQEAPPGAPPVAPTCRQAGGEACHDRAPHHVSLPARCLPACLGTGTGLVSA